MTGPRWETFAAAGSGGRGMSTAVQFSEYGGTDVLQVVDATPPVAGPGQVRIAVRAASVNSADWKIPCGDFQQMMPLEFPAGSVLGVSGVNDLPSTSSPTANSVTPSPSWSMTPATSLPSPRRPRGAGP